MLDWKGRCHRCGQASTAYIMSMFNTELICMECKDAERKRPDYRAAEVKDLREHADIVQAGGNAPAADNIRAIADELESRDV